MSVAIILIVMFSIFSAIIAAPFCFLNLQNTEHPIFWTLGGIAFIGFILMGIYAEAKLLDFRNSQEYKQYEIRITQESIEKAQEKLQTQLQEIKE